MSVFLRFLTGLSAVFIFSLDSQTTNAQTINAQTINAQTTVIEAVLPNVPYAKVAELLTDESLSQALANKVLYGDSNDQYVLHWPAILGATANESNERTTQISPALVFVHGGCWLAQFDIKHSLALTAALAQQGFDVYSIEYRRTGNGGEWPVALQDIQTALASLSETLNQKAADKQRPITLIGHSAGGHLASLAALELAKSHNNIHYVGLAPITDLVNYAAGENSCQTATPGFMQGTPSTHAATYAQANPLNFSFAKLASAQVFSGGEDKIVPAEMARHPDATFTLANEAGHFDWIHPGSSAFKQLVDHLQSITKHE